MKVLDFEVSLEEIKNGKFQLADIIKTCLWEHKPTWLDILNFENDIIFLEPLLSYYFRRLIRGEKPVSNLEQILYGYAPKGSVQSTISVFTDPDGVIYLPNMGYIVTNTEGIRERIITFSNDYKNIILDGKEIAIQPLKLIRDEQFSLINYKPYIYKEIGGISVSFLESIKDSINYSEKKIISALNKIEKGSPSFYDAVKMTTREFAIFNSTNFESFTALHHFGTAFLNLAGQKQKEIFFLDDISHQSGHIIYYALTHDFNKFIKPHRDTPLKEFTNIPYEQRNVYGAFHGLFTYTTILHSLHIALTENWFEGDEREEAIARLGFYYEKFEHDLKNIGDSRILTTEGWRYYDMFQSGFTKIKKEYCHIIKYFDYSNQSYNFSFENFQKINHFQSV